MDIKKKLLGKYISFAKNKKLPKQLAVILLIGCLVLGYILVLFQKLYKKVCLRKRKIISAALIVLISFLSITYFFYTHQNNAVFAGTPNRQSESITVGTYVGAYAQTTDEYEEFTQAQTLAQKPESESVANTFIEGKNPYYIKVNRSQNCVTIYTYDEEGNYTVPLKAMICSTGGENTPLGGFKISSRYEFKSLLYDVYGQYAVRIVGQILFHSSSYSETRKDTLIADEYNRLGEGISHGCIRLAVIDAKWIYDNCPSGTIVEIYEDEDPGPLGRPESITIPADSAWDPTDPDPENPWNLLTPRIEGAVNIKISTGMKVDLYQGIKAYDTCGNDITSQINIRGYVKVNTPGSYKVTYSVTDLLGRTAQTSVVYTVVK